MEQIADDKQEPFQVQVNFWLLHKDGFLLLDLQFAEYISHVCDKELNEELKLEDEFVKGTVRKKLIVGLKSLCSLEILEQLILVLIHVRIPANTRSERQDISKSTIVKGRLYRVVDVVFPRHSYQSPIILVGIDQPIQLTQPPHPNRRL